ncbi:MAG: hypothetical protein R3B51_13930 [Thermodesulfobacteriota bacterium]
MAGAFESWPINFLQNPRKPRPKDRLLGTGREPSFELALGHFAEAISGGFQPSPSLADGLASLRIIEAAEESADRKSCIGRGAFRHRRGEANV